MLIAVELTESKKLKKDYLDQSLVSILCFYAKKYSSFHKWRENW